MSVFYSKKHKRWFYSKKDVQKIQAQYNIILSGRNIGKSYSIAAGSGENDTDGYLKRALDLKKCIVGYVRRFEKETRPSLIVDDFNDKLALIKRWSKDEYDRVVVWDGNLYFAKEQENGSVKRAPWNFGKVFCMSRSEQWKSKQFPDIDTIVYEEFITNEYYIKNEPEKLQNLVSTCARDRLISVWLLGNTVSRTCPYVTDWGLYNIAKQKVGTIDQYEKENEDGSTTLIAVEIAPNKDELDALIKEKGEKSEVGEKKRSMFFGKARESITGSAWQTHIHKKLAHDLDLYDNIYRIRFDYSQFSFYINYLIYTGRGDCEETIFIYPATRDRNLSTIKERRVSNDPAETIFESNCLRSDIPVEQKIMQLYKIGKVAFCDNLTGEDFTQQERQENLMHIY